MQHREDQRGFFGREFTAWPYAITIRFRPSTLRTAPDLDMQIRQAVGTTRTRHPETVRFLHDLVEELKANGFVANALRRAHQPETLAAPLARPPS